MLLFFSIWLCALSCSNQAPNGNSAEQDSLRNHIVRIGYTYDRGSGKQHFSEMLFITKESTKYLYSFSGYDRAMLYDTATPPRLWKALLKTAQISNLVKYTTDTTSTFHEDAVLDISIVTDRNQYYQVGHIEEKSNKEFLDLLIQTADELHNRVEIREKLEPYKVELPKDKKY